jgi:hypothetical protein
MDYTIHPYEGVGPLQLGMTRQEIRAILGEPEKVFQKFPDKPPADQYWNRYHLYVHFKEPDTCDGIEIFPPAEPIFQGINLLTEVPYNQMKDWFQKQDSNIEFNEVGLKSFTYGVALYAPYPNEPVENVYVFEKGHYDGLAEKIERMEAELDRRLAAGLPIDDLPWSVK